MGQPQVGAEQPLRLIDVIKRRVVADMHSFKVCGSFCRTQEVHNIFCCVMCTNALKLLQSHSQQSGYYPIIVVFASS